MINGFPHRKADIPDEVPTDMSRVIEFKKRSIIFYYSVIVIAEDISCFQSLYI